MTRRTKERRLISVRAAETGMLSCTYCSAVKRRDRESIPAIRRYLSPRIRAVYRDSRASGARFAILSGQFGLIGPRTRIPWYDHLLQPDEVAALVPGMAEYLRKKGFGKVLFFHEPLRGNPRLKPYLRAITLACRRAGIPLELHPLPV